MEHNNNADHTPEFDDSESLPQHTPARCSDDQHQADNATQAVSRPVSTGRDLVDNPYRPRTSSDDDDADDERPTQEFAKGDDSSRPTQAYVRIEHAQSSSLVHSGRMRPGGGYVRDTLENAEAYHSDETSFDDLPGPPPPNVEFLDSDVDSVSLSTLPRSTEPVDRGALGSEPDEEEEEDDAFAAMAPKRQRTRDSRGEKAQQFLLVEMHMKVTVERRRPREGCSPDEIHLEMVGPDVGRVIGKKGQVLSALQYLLNRVVNRPGLQRRHVLIDAEGYRYRRESSLSALAKKLAEQAVSEGKIITFEPMSPRDRRVVHLALAQLPNVVTKSDGEGEERCVRIIPVRR